MTFQPGISRCAVAVAAVFHAAGVFAQAQPAGAGGAPQLAPEVVVSATRNAAREFDLPASIDGVDATAIREANAQVNLSETLNRIPGINVQNRQNYAQDLQVSSRGFGGRAQFGVRGVRLIADGIPATAPDGQGQAATFNLSSAARIEVLRGPFANLYGNASGGVVQIFTEDGPKQPTLRASALVGSWGTTRFGVNYGGESGAFNYVIDASRFDTGGYRDHSAATRDHVNAKVKYSFGADSTLTFIGNALDQPDTQDPLGLTRTQFTQNPRQVDPVANTFNTRKSIRHSQGGLVYETGLGGGRFQAVGYLGAREVTQYLSIPLAAQNAATAAGGVVSLDRDFGGLGVRWTRRPEPFGFTVGLDYDRMAERRKGFINNNGVAGALKRDEDDIVSTTDLFGQFEWLFSPRWMLSAGMRTSSVRFESRDYFLAPGNPNDSGSATYSSTVPVAGILFKLSPSVNLYANAGQGFETPTFAELAYRTGGAGLNFALRPGTSEQFEAGAKVNLPGHRLRLAAFSIVTRDEIVVDTNVGGRSTFKNASKTRRDGIEASWESYFGGGFESYLAWTVLDARFKDAFTSGGLVRAGNRLPGVPDSTFFAELLWRHQPTGFVAGIEGRHVGRVFVNDANTDSADPYAIFNLRFSFEQRGKNWKVAEFLRIDNVSDRKYAGSVIVAEGNGRFFEPAPGRGIMLGVSASFGF